MSSNVSARGDVDIDLARLAAALWAKRVVLLLGMLIAGIATFLVASSIDPLYRSEARILIEEREAAVTRGGGGGLAPREMVLDAQAVASQVEVMRSSDLLREVIDELDLRSRAQFDPAAEPSILKDILLLLGLSEDPLEEASQHRILGELRENLEVYQIENSRVIAIRVSSTDPELAAEIANAIAKIYLDVQSGAKLASNAGATAWLEPEIAELQERVRQAEVEVAAFRAESDLFLVGQEDTLSSQQLGDIASELAQVRAERANAEARAANVRQALADGRSTDTISSVLESGLIQRLRERQVAAQSELADLSTALLDGHPSMRGLRSQLDNLERQIRSEIGKALASLESDAAVARLREEELIARLDMMKADSARANSEEVELRALEREATAARQLLETYLARFREAVSRGDPNALPADARIIASAAPSSGSYYPKPIPAVVVVMLAVGLGHTVVIMLSELFSGRALRPAIGATAPMAPVVSRRDEEARRTDRLQADIDDEMAAQLRAAAPAGLEPASAQDESLAEAEPEEDFSPLAVAEAVIALRIRVVAGLSPEGARASLGAVLLARRLSDAGSRVLLVDMTGTAVPSRAMVENGQPGGITDLLCGEITIAEAIHADHASGADIIPLGNSNPEQAMRGASRIGMIIEAVGDAYDIVIVECGVTDIDSVTGMLNRQDLAIVMSVIDPDEALVADELAGLYAAGHEDALLMLAEDDEMETTRDSAA